MANLNDSYILADALKKKIEDLKISSIMIQKSLKGLKKEKVCKERKPSVKRKKTK